MAAVRSGAASDIGRIRTVNEDSSLAEGAVFAVADGMGGHAAGEVASGLTVDRLRHLGAQVEIRPDDVRAQIALANQDILSSVAEHPEQQGMGSTVSGLSRVRFAGLDHWVVFNIGDSRVYRFVAGTLMQVTVDHSEVAEMIAAGEIGAADASTYPRRNVITRALGSDPAPEPDVWVFPAEPGERFVICSDGLCTELGDGEIADVLRAEPTPQGAADELVRRAVRAGGRDNVTVVVVDHDHEPVTDVIADDDELDNTVPRLHRPEPVA